MIEGNFIGTDASGQNALPNMRDGINVGDSASNNTIGGTVAAAANVIAFNTNNGVTIGGNSTDSATGDTILGNSIFSNNFLGIDLGNDGVTPNDAHGHGAGPNLWQNFPILHPPDSTGAIEVDLTSASGHLSHRVLREHRRRLGRRATGAEIPGIRQVDRRCQRHRKRLVHSYDGRLFLHSGDGNGNVGGRQHIRV